VPTRNTSLTARIKRNRLRRARHAEQQPRNGIGPRVRQRDVAGDAHRRELHAAEHVAEKLRRIEDRIGLRHDQPPVQRADGGLARLDLQVEHDGIGIRDQSGRRTHGESHARTRRAGNKSALGIFRAPSARADGMLAPPKIIFTMLVMSAKPAKKNGSKTPPPAPQPATAAPALPASAPGEPAKPLVPWIESDDPRKRMIGKIILVAAWVYVAALWLLALDQTFHWGIFGPKVPPVP